MYPDNFDNLSREQLLQWFEHIYQSGAIHDGTLSYSQKMSLLANLANLRANLNETIQDLDETIEILEAD
jgi:hypothetical protein